MTQVYLNGKFVDQEQATISPMDRGFLFGDGIYEVIPCYNKLPVGLALHLARMNNGLSQIKLNYTADKTIWASIIERLISQFESPSVGVYIHVSRGADIKRYHAYPDNIEPTIFAYAFEIPASQALDINQAKSYEVTIGEDLRWQRCHIKSTSLLGNVMHFQQGKDSGKDEIILYNGAGIITEASACNVFIVKNKQILTPKLDHQLLPGITRSIVLESLRLSGGFDVSETDIHLEQLLSADEVWITSSSKEIGPVVKINDSVVGTGKPGEMWLAAQTAYNKYKFKL